MLNEEKIILMTQMASYEENEGKKNMAIGRYFRRLYCNTGFLVYSVCYDCLCGMLCLICFL